MKGYKTLRISKKRFSRESWQKEVNERVALTTQGFTLEDVDFSNIALNMHWWLKRTPEFTANNMVKQLIRQIKREEE